MDLLSILEDLSRGEDMNGTRDWVAEFMNTKRIWPWSSELNTSCTAIMDVMSSHSWKFHVKDLILNWIVVRLILAWERKGYSGAVRKGGDASLVYNELQTEDEARRENFCRQSLTPTDGRGIFLAVGDRKRNCSL